MERNTTAICLIAHNRPEFFKVLIKSLEEQKGVLSRYDFWLFLDPDEDKQDLSQKCLDLFDQSKLPNQFVQMYGKNVGPAVSMFDACDVPFLKFDYERVIVLEEDLKLLPSYLFTMEKMFERYENDMTVGAVSCTDVTQNPMSNYGVWKRSWMLMRGFMESYVDYIKQFKYLEAPAEELVKRFGVITQDAAKKKALERANLKMVKSENPKAKHIGSHGMHFKDDHYFEKGFDGMEIQAAVDVIIPTWNNPELLDRCLTTFKETVHTPYTIYLFLNGVGDDTREVVERHKSDNIKVIDRVKNLGWIKAVNHCLSLVEDEFVLLLNDDTEFPQDGWLEKLIEVASDPKVGVVGPLTDNGIQYQANIEPTGGVIDAKMVAFFCALFRNEVLTLVGKLDEDFGLGFSEDDLYCELIKRAGYSIKVNTTVMVSHKHRSSFKKLDQNFEELLSNNSALYKKKLSELS